MAVGKRSTGCFAICWRRERERSSRDTGALWVFYIPLSDPAFDPVRKSARFADLLRKANIDSRVVHESQTRKLSVGR